jgi:hypothetical protein
MVQWETDGTGRQKIWVNADDESDTPIKNYTGITLDPDYTEVGMFKLGIYKTGWRTSSTAANQEAMSPRIFYHDDVRIGYSFADACASL